MRGDSFFCNKRCDEVDNPYHKLPDRARLDGSSGEEPHTVVTVAYIPSCRNREGHSFPVDESMIKHLKVTKLARGADGVVSSSLWRIEPRVPPNQPFLFEEEGDRSVGAELIVQLGKEIVQIG